MRLFYIVLLSFFSVSANAQYYWAENFEAPADAYRTRFIIDTVNYHHNLWQIGRPHKAVFDSISACSAPNVIVTDTSNPYAANDTSVFIIQHYYMYTHMFNVNFRYKLDIDSDAIAKVEISGDRGLNWINPITEDTTYMFYWGATKPSLDTSVNTWTNFQFSIGAWLNAYPGGPDTFPHYRTSDTILFRFTFISGNDTNHHDGWMMDNFYFVNAAMEGNVHQVINNTQVSIYPVPSNGTIYYSTTDENAVTATISIYDIKGTEVYKQENVPVSGHLSLSLPDGNYVVKYSTDKSYALKRLVISK